MLVESYRIKVKQKNNNMVCFKRYLVVQNEN